MTEWIINNKKAINMRKEILVDKGISDNASYKKLKTSLL